jgi:hypothetical protein
MKLKNIIIHDFLPHNIKMHLYCRKKYYKKLFSSVFFFWGGGHLKYSNLSWQGINCRFTLKKYVLIFANVDQKISISSFRNMFLFCLYA